MSELSIKETDLQIGHGVYLRWFEREEVRAGAFVIHPAKPGSEFEHCWGTVVFAQDGAESNGNWGFNLNFESPTFTPSILCGECGAHGFIRNGRWEPA